MNNFKEFALAILEFSIAFNEKYSKDGFSVIADYTYLDEIDANSVTMYLRKSGVGIIEHISNYEYQLGNKNTFESKFKAMVSIIESAIKQQ